MAQRYSIPGAWTNLPTIHKQVERGLKIARLRGSRSSFSVLDMKFLQKHRLADICLDADFAASVRHRGAGRGVILAAQPIRSSG